MWRSGIVAVVAGLAAGPALAQSPAKPLDGYWKPESIRFDGAEQLPSPAARAALTLVIKDGEYRAYHCTDAAKDVHFRLFTADLRLDPAGKTFELFVKGGQRKDERRHGIYDLKDGRLALCYGPADKPRPAAFDAPKGSGYFCETWVAEKK